MSPPCFLAAHDRQQGQKNLSRRFALREMGLLMRILRFSVDMKSITL